MSIIFAILLFSILIFVHELGHFMAAKYFGVRVNEFAVFMGPVLYKKQVGETLYSIRCIPIGGFCAMEGEDEDTDDPRSFLKAAWWKRLIILVAGAAMNFLIGLLLFFAVYLPSDSFVVPQIGYFEENCTLQGEAGLQLGDRIWSLDGERVYISSDFEVILSLYPGEVHDLVVVRDGRRVELDDFSMVKAEFPNSDGSTSLRYGFSFSLTEATFLQRLAYAWDNALSSIQIVILSLKMLLTGQIGVQEMGGPVMIVDQMSQIADLSPTVLDATLNMLNFGAFLAINLAVMNLLPVPALDGGRAVGVLLTTAVEKLTRKKLDPKYEGYLHMAGMILLLALMGFVMLKDIFTIIKR